MIVLGCSGGAVGAARAQEPAPPSVAPPPENGRHGGPRFGLQGELGGAIVMWAVDNFALAGVVGAFGFVDVVVDRDETLRLGVYADFLSQGEYGPLVVPDGTGGVRLDDHRVLTGGPGVGLRMLGGIDVTDRVVFRAGVDLGLGFPGIPFDPFWNLSAVGRFELAVRLLESRSLELGVAAYGGMRAGGDRWTGAPSLPPDGRFDVITPGLTVFVAWVFD